VSRQAQRDTIKTALEGLGRFSGGVYKGAKRSFKGASPIAVILSRSYDIVDLTRDGHDQLDLGFSVRVYVRADDGTEETAEDVLDELVALTTDALRDAGFTVGQSDAEPDGTPLRNIDGVYYRAERITADITEYD
jgi:hypothetical protein